MNFAIFAVLLLTILPTFAKPAHSLTVGEGFVNPLGFHNCQPVFSWQLPEGAQKQTAYHIEAKAGDKIWDSGWVNSAQSTLVPYGGAPLISRQQVEWKVSFRDENGHEASQSEPAHFEMGLLSAQDWKAQWIRPVDLPPVPQVECKVTKAIYRSKAHPELARDVTEIVQKQTDGFTVGNETLGSDPVLNEAKELILNYTINGEEKTGIFDEKKVVSLVPVQFVAESVGVLRRSFPVGKVVTRARIYVTARGLFELELNGQKVGSDHFANGWTSYNKRLDTLTYDVTDQLRKGDNTIQALLGKGWYAGRIGFDRKKPSGRYGETPELLLQLELTYQDGSSDIIPTDEKWEGSHAGPVVSSSIYDGEDYDARKVIADWKPVLANPDLGKAQLIPKPFAPVREKETLTAQNVTEPTPGHFIFDLGQNMVGWARIKMPVLRDQTIQLRFAEMLMPDGTLYTANYRSAKSTDSYTAAASGQIEWQPHFTFHGFRYVELSGLPAGVKPEKEWVTGVVLHSDLTRIGKFESSDPKLNQLQSNINWGWRGNSVDIPTDCPQRDERLGWTGDAQAFCPTAMLNYDCLAFFQSWLGSMRDDQLADGRVSHVVPGLLGSSGSPGWMDAATIIPWEVYVRTGDSRVLADNFGMMEKLVGWYRKQAVDGITAKIHGFGDWLQPYAKDTKGDTPFALIGTAFYAQSAQILADSARVLKRDANAARYAEEAAAVKLAFQKQYFDADGKLQNSPETQTAYVLALAFNLVPAEARERAGANLVRLVSEAEDHLRTGFLGTPYLTKVLDDTGHGDVAYKLLFQETYPSWFYPINQGATTMWERWNSYTKDKGFGPVDMNSFNHYAYGAIGQWMMERIAGLAVDPANPGYKHFFVRPLIGVQLDSARAELDTPYGKASSAWMQKNRKVAMDIVVPPNTTATIEFPDNRKPETVVAGIYHFDVNLK